MKKLKIHIKIKNKPACGAHKQKRKLCYADDANKADCGNCLRAAAK